MQLVVVVEQIGQDVAQMEDPGSPVEPRFRGAQIRPCLGLLQDRRVNAKVVGGQHFEHAVTDGNRVVRRVELAAEVDALPRQLEAQRA